MSCASQGGTNATPSRAPTVDFRNHVLFYKSEINLHKSSRYHNKRVFARLPMSCIKPLRLSTHFCVFSGCLSLTYM